MKIVRLNINNLQWKLLRDVPSGNWVAVCDQLGITMGGETFTELQECIGEGLNALFLDLLRDNQMDEFFRERGWSLVPLKPDDAEGQDIKFDVPWFLTQATENDSANSFH
jgi:hypothetical protein